MRALAERVGERLRAQGKRLAFAESCTGGLVGHLITNVPGSSDYFCGSAVTYSYEAKERVLGVQHETLIRYGAVSAETAREMAQNARRLFGVDVAVSITGIAGPGGGTLDKPVGLVHIHLSAPDADWGERYVWPYDREGNKLASAKAALQLLLRYLEAGAEHVRGTLG
ncbi:MAG: CinA family protein [Anaerolineae bacterium]|nr:CinA family protein [Anaerolineae bacterium]